VKLVLYSATSLPCPFATYPHAYTLYLECHVYSRGTGYPLFVLPVPLTHPTCSVATVHHFFNPLFAFCPATHYHTTLTQHQLHAHSGGSAFLLYNRAKIIACICATLQIAPEVRPVLKSEAHHPRPSCCSVGHSLQHGVVDEQRQIIQGLRRVLTCQRARAAAGDREHARST
jgi:hypothetical protein